MIIEINRTEYTSSKYKIKTDTNLSREYCLRFCTKAKKIKTRYEESERFVCMDHTLTNFIKK